jgi:hypothetical protein
LSDLGFENGRGDTTLSLSREALLDEVVLLGTHDAARTAKANPGDGFVACESVPSDEIDSGECSPVR